VSDLELNMRFSGVPGAVQHERSEVMHCRPGTPVLRAGHAFLIAATLLLGASSANAAGSVAAGRQKALQCQTCHGLDGMSKLPEAPNIGGQPEIYLGKSLDEFRKGVRKNDMMSIVVQQLSDQDIADLAAYYAAIEITAKPPPK
jgi:cytochrome c553